MRLAFTYNPGADVREALAFYRDTLGWREAWRDGDTTVAFTIPGTEVQFMVDSRAEGGRPGPAFIVDDVIRFCAEHADHLTITGRPRRIPGGHWASVLDPTGNPLYLIDQLVDRVAV